MRVRVKKVPAGITPSEFYWRADIVPGWEGEATIDMVFRDKSGRKEVIYEFKADRDPSFSWTCPAECFEQI